MSLQIGFILSVIASARYHVCVECTPMSLLENPNRARANLLVPGMALKTSPTFTIVGMRRRTRRRPESCMCVYSGLLTSDNRHQNE